MDIVVCVKAVPSHAENPSIVNNGFNVEVESASFIMNESDEYALEQAVAIKKTSRATITVITVASPRSQDVLYRCLAKGADAALRVDGDEFDPNLISFKLARAFRKLRYDLILTGVESLDGMSSQVGISLASRLEIPFAYAVTRVEAAHDEAIVIDRELGGGRHQTLRIATPALLCIQSGTITLTYPPAVKLVQARKKPIPCWSLSDLEITEDQLTSQRKIKFVKIEAKKTSGAIAWVTGTAENIADEIFDRIKKAL
jgi:electron transfer flavoprotein beta subunit